MDHNFRHKTRTRTVRVRFLWRSFGARIRTLFLFLSFSGALKHLFRVPAARSFPSGLYLHPYSPSAVHRTCGFRSPPHHVSDQSFAYFCPSSGKPPKYDNVNPYSTECRALSDYFLRDMPEDSSTGRHKNLRPRLTAPPRLRDLFPGPRGPGASNSRTVFRLKHGTETRNQKPGPGV